MAKSTPCGACWRRFSLRRASSWRFLNAMSEAAVWPLRPREVVTLDQSSLVAAERWSEIESVVCRRV